MKKRIHFFSTVAIAFVFLACNEGTNTTAATSTSDQTGNTVTKEKETDKAKKVNKLIVSFDVENRIAQSGPADMYVVVTAPDGQVISNPSMGSGVLSTRNEGERQFTSKASIEYEQGTRKTVSVPLRQDKFQTGNYKIEVFHNGFKIAEGNRSLRKSGFLGL